MALEPRSTAAAQTSLKVHATAAPKSTPRRLWCDCAADEDADGLCDDIDECVGELDECGVCNGPGAIYDCGCAVIPEGQYDCEAPQRMRSGFAAAIAPLT